MKKGLGFVVAMIVITLFVSMCMKPKKEVFVGDKAKVTDQNRALNDIVSERFSSAVQAYNSEYKHYPESPEEMIQALDNKVPKEAFSGLTKVVTVYDGSGGWVFRGGSLEPNHPQVIP